MRVVGYVRTSWAEQVQGSFPSIEEQEEKLRKFAEKTGLKLDRVYSDSGLSPTQGTCAGMIHILDTMNDGWEAVVLTSPCRLKNIPTLSFNALQELRENGRMALVTDEATAKQLAKRRPEEPARPVPTGETETVRRREIAARLFRGREAGAKAGKHQSGPAPFGYRRDYSRRATEGVLLVPDVDEADVVRMIFREYLRLRSMKRLIKLLDEQGLRTRRGKCWSRAGVSWILKNDTYVGRVHFGDIRVKGRHESLVPPIMFNKVQKLIRANNKRNRKQFKASEAARVEAKSKAKPKVMTRLRRQRQPAASGSGVT